MTLSDVKQQISSLSNHPQVLQSPQLKRLFDDLQRQLVRGDAPETALASFSQSLSLYLMTNHYEAPKAVLDFASQASQELSRHRGRASALKMLALSLLGLSK